MREDTQMVILVVKPLWGDTLGGGGKGNDKKTKFFTPFIIIHFFTQMNTFYVFKLHHLYNIFSKYFKKKCIMNW